MEAALSREENLVKEIEDLKLLQKDLAKTKRQLEQAQWEKNDLLSRLDGLTIKTKELMAQNAAKNGKIASAAAGAAKSQKSGRGPQEPQLRRDRSFSD